MKAFGYAVYAYVFACGYAHGMRSEAGVKLSGIRGFQSALEAGVVICTAL